MSSRLIGSDLRGGGGLATHRAAVIVAALALALTGCGGLRVDDALGPVDGDAAVQLSGVRLASVEGPAVSPAPAIGTSARMPQPAAWASAPRLRADAASPPAIGAVAAVLLDEGSAAVLLERAPDVPLPPASLTKIATAVVALERGNLNEWVTVDVDSRVMRGSTVMGLIPGDRFTLRDLMYGMMLPSGNDAALAIGRHVAGGDAEFVREMNELLLRLGLTEGHFANPHGLNGANHAISARNLALLARYAMTFPEFRTIVGAEGWTADGSRGIPMTNLMNGMLYAVPGADGVKSGFTRSAGRTMVVSALRDGRRLYAVVLNDPQREADTAALIEWGFASYEWATPTVSALPAPAAVASVP